MKRKLKWFWLVMMGLSVQLYALTPSTPTVSASDGTYPDKVHVSISGGGILKAPSYEIYRNNISSCAAENGCRMIYKDGTSSYDDTDVKRDTTYYYWARVCDGTSCSDYSSYNTGYAHLDKPPKTSIDASDGTYTDKVELTIKPQSEATSYKIYRSIKNSLPTAEYKTVTATSYNDTSVKAGTTYYYWVKACNDAGCSSASDSDSGYAKAVSPPPATELDASDGTYTDKIVVKINSVSGATEYRLYRSEKDTLPSNVYATTTSTQYKDTSVTQGTTYYYWVKACNSGGCSAASKSDSGYAKVPVTIPPVTTLSASDGTYTDKIVLSINPSSGATSYKIYRAKLGLLIDNAVPIATVSGTTYNDTDVEQETTYYYWVKACSSAGCSAVSDYDTGRLKLTPPAVPQNIRASDGTYTDKVVVELDSIEHATSYWFYRSCAAGEDGDRISMMTSTRYDDTSAEPNINYFYRVKACNSAGCSALSTYDIGYLQIQASTTLAPPAGVNATIETDYDKVTVTYRAVENATSYKIYRSIMPAVDEGAYVGSSETLSWEDRDKHEGMLNYWVKACDDSSCSDFSTMAVGKFKPFDISNIEISIDVFEDFMDRQRLAVLFTFDSHVDHYNLYRSTVSDFSEDELKRSYSNIQSRAENSYWINMIANGTKVEIRDPGPNFFHEPMKPYYYRVEACNADETVCKTSETTSGWIGWLYRYNEPVLSFLDDSEVKVDFPIDDIAFFEGQYDLYERIEIFRSETDQFADAVLSQTFHGLGETEGRLDLEVEWSSWIDRFVEHNRTYHYWVRYCNSYGCSRPKHNSIKTTPRTYVTPDKKALVILNEFGEYLEGNISWYQVPPKDLMPDELEEMVTYIHDNVIVPVQTAMDEIGDLTFLDPSVTGLRHMMEVADERIVQELRQHQDRYFARLVTQIHDTIDNIKEEYPYLPDCANDMLNTFYGYGAATDQFLVTYEEDMGSCLKEIAGPYYDRIILFTDDNATFKNFKNELYNLHLHGYSIDILFSAHGNGVDKSYTLNNADADKSGLCFYAEDGSGCDYRVKQDFLDIVVEYGKMNIGSVYMTSCWGSQMSDAWFAIGAKEANGAFQTNWYGNVSSVIYLDLFSRKGQPMQDAAGTAYHVENLIHFSEPIIAELDLRPAMNRIFPILEEAPIPCGVEIGGIWFGLDKVTDEYSTKDYCRGSVGVAFYEFETICPPLFAKKYRVGNDVCVFDALGSLRDEMHWEYDLASEARKMFYKKMGEEYGHDKSKPVNVAISSSRVHKVAPRTEIDDRIFHPNHMELDASFVHITPPERNNRFSTIPGGKK